MLQPSPRLARHIGLALGLLVLILCSPWLAWAAIGLELVIDSMSRQPATLPPATRPPATLTASPTAIRATELNLTISGLEITQAIQHTNNSVPLVSERTTFVRVWVQHNANRPLEGVNALLHALSGEVELANSPLQPYNSADFVAQPNPARLQVNDTLNFVLPVEWVTGRDLTLWVEVNPNHSVPERNYHDNRSPAQVAHFNPVPALKVVLIPIAYQKNGQGETFRPLLTSANQFGLGMLQKLYPVANVAYTIHPELLYRGNMQSNQGWYDVLDLLTRLRQQERPNEPILSATQQPKYYGVLPMQASYWGGMAYLSATIGAGLVEQEDVAAHEIGHNLGLLHAPCGGPSNVDRDYPYPDAIIGDVGWDIVERSPLAPTTYDLMSYCWPKWISDFYYRKMLAVLQQVPQSRSRALTLAQPTWAVSGWINAERTGGELANALPLTSTNVATLPGTGDFSIELRNAANSLLWHYAFTPATLDLHEQTVAPAAFSLLAPQRTDTARIQLYAGTSLLDELIVGPPPAVAATQLAALDDPDAIIIAWTLTAGPQGVVNLRYSPDNGASWQVIALGQTGSNYRLDTRQLPGSANGLVEVVASDGTSTRSQQLPIGPVANKAPSVVIWAGAAVSLAPGEPLLLTGAASDLEEGPLPTTSLQWRNAQGQLLATGSALSLPAGFVAGSYRFTLEGRDQANAVNQAAMIVTVASGRQLFLPWVAREGL